MDVKRMWLRNCGRDDRLVADRGREARHPFLDEQLMALILDLPLQCIADLRLQPGDASQDGVRTLKPPLPRWPGMILPSARPGSAQAWATRSCCAMPYTRLGCLKLPHA